MRKSLVQFADPLNRGLQFLIAGQTTLYVRDLILAETDLADACPRVADGENGHGMPFATLAFRTTGAVTDDTLEQGSAEDVPGAGEGGGEAIAFAEGGRMPHY
jgi:hypothetical protein